MSEKATSSQSPEAELRTRVSALRDAVSDERAIAILDTLLPSLDTAHAMYLLGTAGLVVRPREAGPADLFVIFDANQDVRLSIPAAREGEFEDYSINPSGVFRNGFDEGRPLQEPLDEAGSLSVIELLKPYGT